MRLVTSLIVLLLSASALCKEPYPHQSADRPLTLPGAAFVVGGNAALTASWTDDPADPGHRPGLGVAGDLLLQAGITDRVQLTLPLVLTISLGDRNATASPEFAVFGGVRRFGVLTAAMFPTVGASVRKRLESLSLRGDLELRGTTPIRFGTLGGHLRSTASVLYPLSERVTLGGGILVDGWLNGPNRYGPAPLTTERRSWVRGRLWIGGTEETPLLRWAAGDHLDVDLNAQLSPGQGSVELLAGIGLRILINIQREPSPPEKPSTAFPTIEGVESD